MATLAKPPELKALSAQEIPQIVLPGPLPLTGTEPVDIWVRVIDEKPEFSTDKIQWYSVTLPSVGSIAINWTCGPGTYALIITFHLLELPGQALELKTSNSPTLYFSPVIHSPDRCPTQITAIPPVNASTIFHFNVTDHDNFLHDPGALVTPG